MTARAWRSAVVALAALLAAGCASFPVTGRLDSYDSDKGYRYDRLEANGNGDELFVVLTFSGGGTRAAAFAYGVIEELRKTTVAIGGERRNLLEEVDLISSISGGSFTAAYYGLRGEEIFEEGGRFQRNFLYRDVQGELIQSLFNPYNWLRLASPEFGRIELATELYQELLFDKATFGDLDRQARKPYLMINATDMTKGSQFTFVQPQFDPLCADLGTVPIARAVAASSNFPVAFTPLTLNSYPGSCNYTEPPWVENALNDLDVNPRRYYGARLLRSYQEKNREYVHLLDGGVADNIGLRGPLTSLTSGDVSPSILNKLSNKQIKKLVVIVVDAKNETPNPADQSPDAPELAAVINSIATVPLDNYSFDTLELLQEVMRTRDKNQRLQPGLHQVEMYRIYIGFDQIKDEAERARFFSTATSFDLPKEQVDALRRMGAELLRQSPCLKALVASGSAPEQPGASRLCP
ncbi:MAG: patatin-like phospholipase family protein [Gammaproteobacteria bacterium]